LQCKTEDRYRRKVCVVFVDGQDVGLEHVKAGLAWWYRKYANEQSLHDRVNYGDAEFNARRNRVSLWQSNRPIPPWEWRKKKQSLD
jgi:endonuclease YncB( thermonuclease family)